MGGQPSGDVLTRKRNALGVILRDDEVDDVVVGRKAGWQPLARQQQVREIELVKYQQEARDRVEEEFAVEAAMHRAENTQCVFVVVASLEIQPRNNEKTYTLCDTRMCTTCPEGLSTVGLLEPKAFTLSPTCPHRTSSLLTNHRHTRSHARSHARPTGPRWRWQSSRTAFSSAAWAGSLRARRSRRSCHASHTGMAGDTHTHAHIFN